MAKYFQDKNNVYVAPDHATEIFDRLPPRAYTLCFSPLTGFYLEFVDALEVPTEIYGSILDDTDRIIKTYLTRSTNTGVLLSGEKGSGKTMTARLLSKKCIEKGIPTIIINNNTEEDFCKFISNINQKCLILFDEFEKTFSGEENQNKLLTLFDGTYTSDKLLVLTVNNTFRVNEFFINRPGRIYYHKKYDSLEEVFIQQYCKKNLHNQEHIQPIINLSKFIHKFNFDMLQAIVYECNLHKKKPQDVFDLLNIDYGTSSYSQYKFTVKNIKLDRKYTGKSRMAIFTQDLFWHTSDCNEDYDDADDEQENVELSQENLISAKNGIFKFKDRDCEISLEKVQSNSNFYLDW